MTKADSTPQVLAVDRRLGDLDRDGTALKVLTATQHYPDAIDDVWSALTSAERLARWFAPVSGDFQPGGRFQIEGNAEGEVLACNAPNQLSVTWEFGGQVSWVDVELSEDSDGTTLALTHTAPVIPGFWEVYGPGAVGIGWDLSLVGLVRHLQNPAAVIAGEAAAEWESTDDYRAFVDASSAAWADTAVAAGEPAELAERWRVATAAFYKGEELPSETVG